MIYKKENESTTDILLHLHHPSKIFISSITIMKSIATFLTIGLFASIGLAGPTVRLSDNAGLETRGTASGCDY